MNWQSISTQETKKLVMPLDSRSAKIRLKTNHLFVICSANHHYTERRLNISIQCQNCNTQLQWNKLKTFNDFQILLAAQIKDLKVKVYIKNNKMNFLL